MNVLMVCTGNTCRSPMAAALLSKLRPDWQVSSAGIAALEGQPAAPEAKRAVRQVGLSLEDHRAHQLGAEDVRKTDWVLAMTRSQVKWLRAQYPDEQHKIMSLGSACGEDDLDVEDPVGRDQDVYVQVREQLSRLLEKWANDQRGLHQ